MRSNDPGQRIADVGHTHRITFAASTLIPASADAVFDWHEEPGAFQRLTPPREPVRVLSDTKVASRMAPTDTLQAALVMAPTSPTRTLAARSSESTLHRADSGHVFEYHVDRYGSELDGRQMRIAAEKRVEASLGHSRRQHYGHVAMLVGQCVSLASTDRKKDQEGFPRKSVEGGGLKNRCRFERKSWIRQVLISRTLTVCGEVAERLKAALC